MIVTQSYFSKNIVGLAFILTCNYTPDKLPVMLSKFHQQFFDESFPGNCFIHNFSPHRNLLWNNECIAIRNIIIISFLFQMV